MCDDVVPLGKPYIDTKGNVHEFLTYTFSALS
jgi:hypothetical protein